MSKIDWSKAGTRILFQPNDVFGKNPDFLWVEQRWKDEADYWGEDLDPAQVIELVGCETCGRCCRVPCVGGNDEEIGPHRLRRRRAGEWMLRVAGPRFTKKGQENG